MSPDYNKAKQHSEKVLTDNFVTAPPVNVREISRNYGLDVVEVDFGEDLKNVAGLINVDRRIIYVNSTDSEARKAFTIAHELGHWLMHKEELVANPDKLAILYRIPLGELNKDPLESEANFFAANLLVPNKLLDGHRGEKTPEEIATLFGVSVEVIGYRLQDEYAAAR